MADEIDLLNNIGNILARDTDYPLEGTFLYIEAGRGWVDIAAFKDLGDHLLWRHPEEGLADALLELWNSAPAAKRWSTMQYGINGGEFAASFTYDPLDPEITTIDRQELVLAQRYGNKGVVYPPIGDGFPNR